MTMRIVIAVLLAAHTVIRDEPENNFLSKYHLVKALTIGESGQAEAFEEALREIISKFDGTPEAEKAAELLSALNEAKSKLARESKESSKPTGSDITDLASQAEDKAEDSTSVDPAALEMFTQDDASDHFFALIYPKDNEVGNELRNLVSDFNGKYFGSDGLRMTNSFIDKDHQIMIVRSFAGKDAAMRYFNYFKMDEELLGPINDKGYQTFVITTKNFTTLFRNKNPEVYRAFFESTYTP